MAYEMMGRNALNYLPCRYGSSRLVFRGPKKNMAEPYVVFLGGTKTYGRFLQDPFPNLVECRAGITCLNLGCVGAGIDVFVQDPFIHRVTANAAITVIQILGAQNLSNRYYYVHPRRNDRFVAPTQMLRSVFPEVDFSEFHFTKHLLQTLRSVSASRFELVQRELQCAWMARMRNLLQKAGGKTVLLWFADHPPENGKLPRSGLGTDPLFISKGMIEQIGAHATKIIEVIPSRGAQKQGTSGMVFSQMEAPSAAQYPGVRAHEEAATAITEGIEQYV